VSFCSWAQSDRENVDTEFIQFKIPSNILKKSLNGNFYRLGNAKQRLDGNDFLPSLNLAKVFRIQIHRFGQLLLSQSGSLSLKANGIPNLLSVSQHHFPLFLQVGHSARRLGCLPSNQTPATCWYFIACFSLG